MSRQNRSDYNTDALQSEAVWLHCNDEQVRRSDSTKRIKIMDDDYSRMRTSKDAYMLVYMRNGLASAINPPDEILNRVLEGNETLNAEIEERLRL